MIGPDEIKRYQGMTPDQKLREFSELMDVAFSVLMELSPDERKRRWMAMEREEEESARTLARRFAQGGT